MVSIVRLSGECQSKRPRYERDLPGNVALWRSPDLTFANQKLRRVHPGPDRLSKAEAERLRDEVLGSGQ